MAGATLIALIDDISTVLDDVASQTKIAAVKTSGVVGDDLALNANQVAGVNADRELPVVWEVAKGSAKNKAVIIPGAIGLSAAAPLAITPVLMMGGTYLVYEGAEKLIEVIQEKVFHKKHKPHPHGIETDAKEMIKHHHEKTLGKEAEMKAEREKINGAIKTDFVLSLEIIVIALGTVAAAPLMSQAATLVAVGAAMTVGVYGLVGGIVKADDVGLFLSQLNKENFVEKMDGLVESAKKHNKWIKPFTLPFNYAFSGMCKTLFNNDVGIKALNGIGEATLKTMPKFMKGLSVAGTVAMFTVGGSILSHGIPGVHHLMEILPEAGVLHTLGGIAVEAGVGLVAGLTAVGVKHVTEPLVDPIMEKLKPLVKSVKNFTEQLFSNKKESKNEPSVEKKIDIAIEQQLRDDFAQKEVVVANKPKEESTFVPRSKEQVIAVINPPQNEGGGDKPKI